MLQLAEILPPKLLAGKVVADHPGRAVAGYHPRTVGHGGGGTIGVVGVRALFFQIGSFSLPQELSVGPIKTHNQSSATLVDCLGEENTVAPDDGAGVAALG